MKCEKKGGRLLFVATLLIALCFAISIVADAQKPSAPPKGAPVTSEKAGPPAPEKKGQQAMPGEQKGAQAEKGAEYAACSPEFPGEQIAGLVDFVGVLSSDLPGKLKPVLLNCDLAINNQLLGFLEDMQREIADAEFENEDQEKRFLGEKAKEVEIQLLLVQKPVKESEVKKLVAEIFELRQKSMNDQVAFLEKEAADLKKRLEERKKLKDQIVERKLKEITSEEPPKRVEGGSSGDDKLAWD